MGGQSISKRGIIPVFIIIAIIIAIVGASSVVYLVSKDKDIPQEDKNESDFSNEPNISDDQDNDGNGSPASGGGGSRDGSQGGGSSGGSGGNNGNEGENEAKAPWEENQMNVVLIYTDDQREDTLWAMDTVTNEFLEKGITFTRAYDRNPLCCPSRASFISGGFFPENTLVKHNNYPNGGAPLLEDDNTLFVKLQRQGYRTALIGKYMNSYENIKPYIPPGYDLFVASTKRSDWYDYKMVEGSSLPDSPGLGEEKRIREYMTYYEREKALEFIDETALEGSPFFLFLSVHAPHGPATPAPGDGEGEENDRFADYNSYKENPNWQEEDISDKPVWLHEVAKEHLPKDEKFVKDQLRSLQAVDRLVADVMQKTRDVGEFENTIFIYASDNGYQWGEHKLEGKSKPYEESIRLPLVFKIPGFSKSEVGSPVFLNEDLAVTILEIAGVNQQSDGKSLLTAILNPSVKVRDHLFVQGYSDDGPSDKTPLWAAIIDEKYKYIEYADYLSRIDGRVLSGDNELYDLDLDPFEIESKDNDPEFQNILEDMKSKLHDELSIGIKTPGILPEGRINQNYPTIHLEPWGGDEPYVWSVYEGELPKGLTLLSNGVIEGSISADETPGEKRFFISVEDGYVSNQNGDYGRFVKQFSLNIPSGGSR